MTTPRRRRADQRRPAPKIRPAQLLVALAVLAIFVVGVVLAGMIGAILLGVLAIAAGVLLVLRWQALDQPVRLFRAFAVLACLAVAISLLYR